MMQNSMSKIMMLKNTLTQINFFNRLVKKRQVDKYFIINSRLYHNFNEEISPINIINVKRFFKLVNVPFLEGHACIIACSKICNDNKHKECKIYINKITGFFECENCYHTGTWNTLESFLQSKKSKKPVAELSFQNSTEELVNLKSEWKNLKSTLQPIINLPEVTYNQIMKTLNLQIISKEIMSQMDVLYDENSNSLYFPLMAFRNLVVGYKTLSLNNLSEKTFPIVNTSGVLTYKQKNLKTDAPAVVVYNIEDFLTLISEKAFNSIICLPYGLQCIPQQILPTLECYKKLILWFGNDNTSWDIARQFAKKLNDQRCDFVRPTDQQPKPSQAFKLGYNLKEIIQNAQPIWHKSITTFHSLREDVLSDLQNNDKVQGVKWKRYPALNKILKGHRRGEFTVLTGPTGCGKTTFMSEYSLDLAMQGVNTLWGSFEIRNARLAKTMLQQMVEVPLDENLDKYNTFADAFEKLPIYFMTFHGQQNIKVVMEAVEHATYVHDIAHVIIDNVQFMMGMDNEPKFMDRFWKQDKIIAAFRQFATKFNCHVSLVIHPRKEKEESDLTTSSIFGGAKASQEADNVLIVQDKRLTSLRGKKFLQVAKNRYSGDLGIMVLEFDKTSLSYAQKKKSKSTEKDVSVANN